MALPVNGIPKIFEQFSFLPKHQREIRNDNLSHVILDPTITAVVATVVVSFFLGIEVHRKRPVFFPL